MGSVRRITDVSAEDRVTILADDRENAGGVIAQLRARADVELTVQRLRFGDFVIADHYVVERKTLRDFAVSVIDGRLFRQSAAIAANASRGVIILEGSPATAADLGVSRAALQGALITITVFYGLALLRSRDSAETAQLLIYLGRQAKHLAEGGLPRHGYRPKGKRARQLFILQGLPGVGPGCAEKLLERFESIQGVASAPLDDLVQVDGIGPRRARRIRWALEESPRRHEP